MQEKTQNITFDRKLRLLQIRNGALTRSRSALLTHKCVGSYPQLCHLASEGTLKLVSHAVVSGDLCVYKGYHKCQKIVHICSSITRPATPAAMKEVRSATPYDSRRGILITCWPKRRMMASNQANLIFLIEISATAL